jgi:two-component system NtrC family sensor kinase
MRFFQNMSIRGKQTLIMTLTSSVVLLLACATFSIYEVITFRKAMVVNLTTLAEIVGNNTVAALDFNDAPSATETLSALQVEPDIIGAFIYTKNGDVFVKYNRTNDAMIFAPPVLQKTGYTFAGQRLTLSSPIVHKGETIGAVYLESDMRALYSRLTRYAGIVSLVFLASLLFAFILSNRLQRLVSGPILHLAQVAQSVAVEKNYAVRATKRSNDELGQLVDGFNEMLTQIQARDTALQMVRDNLEKRVEERTQELENIHKLLLDASRRGGMAEIATNVLHNVGNVLNSVNVSTDLIIENVKKSKAPSLARVVVLLRQHTQDLGDFITKDARGKHVPAHLAQLSEHLMADQQVIVTELESLRRNVEHIKEIVTMQQSYATVGGVKEMINVVDLVEDSLRMNEGAMNRHCVEVVREFDHVPPINVEKHKILQILVNLMRNAKYACDESDRPDKRLTVRVANGNGQVKVSVIDNGVGIPPENLARIFNHGFTTRKGGHGFGLHSGALAAKEMGGSLSVQSNGLGQGAAFTLELPCPAQGSLHA